MKKVLIQYKVKKEKAPTVEALLKKVFEELQEVSPKNISYSAQKFEDGQTFIHMYVADGNIKNPVVDLSSFIELQEFIKFNNIEKPFSSNLIDIDNYDSIN